MSHNKIVKIKLLDEVNAVVMGLTSSEYTTISDIFSLHPEGYFFNPKFKAKIWDGYIRFFKKNGRTFIKLLPEIVPILKQLGYKLEIIDNRDTVNIKIPMIDKNYLQEFGWILGDHQVETVNILVSNNGGLVEAATGAGKTICSWILHDLYKTYCDFDTLIIVPTRDLIKQTVEEFKQFSNDIGFWGDSKKDTDHPVVISTWQTLKNNPSFVGKYKHIILDECHSGKNFSGNVNKILNEYASNCYIKMGMTGTFPENACDMKTLQSAMGDVLYQVKASYLMSIGWLSSMELSMIELDEEFLETYNTLSVVEKINKETNKSMTYNEFLKSQFPEYSNERVYLMKQLDRSKYIAKFIISIMEREKLNNSLVLVKNKKQGKLLNEFIPNSIFIDGLVPSIKRKKIFDSFATNNDIVLISTFSLASIGLNIKRIFNIFLLDSEKGFINVIQSIGRGLRKAFDKNKINVYDIYSNLYHAKRHATKRRKHYETEGHKINKSMKIKYKGKI
jgi:superfamily II DNA or RNA helicase